MLNLLIRLGALMGSYFGWWEYFRRRWKVNVHFLPAFTLAVHFTLLYLPGLFNFLEEASLVLYFGGMLLALDALRREKLALFKPYCTVGFGVFAALMVLIFLGVRGKSVLWFDNFTHWATVVKNMLMFDRFPTVFQEAVGFPTYPLGSSTLVYYFCNVTSDAESFQMLAQGFLCASMLLGTFAYVKKAPILCGVLAALLGNFLLCYNIPVTELLVDTLLPLTAMTAILFFRHQCLDREVGGKYSVYFAFPLLFLTMNIKNASFFFLAAAFGLMLLWQKQKGRSLKPLLWLLLAMAAGWFLWNKHCDYVFINSEMTQHAISAAYLQGRLSEKTPAVMWEIVQGVFAFAFTRRDLPWVAGAAALLGVLTWAAAPQLRRTYGKLLAFLVPFHLLYTLSLAGMYVFSMSAEGALGLESIERYMRTADIAVFYLLLVYTFCLAGQARTPLLGTAAALLVTAGTLGMWLDYGRPLLSAPAYDPGTRVEIEDLLAEYGVAPGHSYLVLCQEENQLYRHYIYRYCLNSPYVTTLAVTGQDQLDAQTHHSYIIIEDTENPLIQAWVQEQYPSWAGEQVIQDFY